MADVSLDIDCKDPHELYARGIRELVVQNYEAAASIISKAAELLVDHYKDDTHEEMGKVYLDYGKALLGYYREQVEALGDAVQKKSLNESDEDEGTGTEEPNVSREPNSEEVEEEEVSECSDEPKETASEASGSAEPGPVENIGGCTEDEPNDLQLAWEVLELAKTIFVKNGDRKSLAETIIVLGEIQLENESFENAINDLKDGLSIQKGLFGIDSRTIAETLYKLGMAYCIASEVNLAIGSFKESLTYLTNKIEALEAEAVSTSALQDEITEIKSLLPEIKDKISEMVSYRNEALKKAAEKITETSSSVASDPSPSSSNKPSDISHLVRRKRQSEEVDKLSEEAACKKQAVDVKN